MGSGDTPRDFCVIEDTEIINSGYSVLLSALILETDLFKGCRPIFWRSPCWQSGKFGRPLLSDNSTYIHQYNFERYEDISGTFYEWQESDGKYCLEITNELLSLAVVKDQRICLGLLNNLKYHGNPVGLACSSTILRLQPSSNLTLSTTKESVSSHMFKLICAITYFTKSGIVERCRYFIPSESVYLASALVHYFVSHGAMVPYLYSSDSPLWINNKHLNDANGVSPRLLSFRQLRSKSLKSSSTSEKWLSRYKTVGSINNASESQINAVASLGSDIAKGLGVTHLNNYLDIRSNELIGCDLQFVFYLHAITDGPYLHGYSGYITPYEFYEEILKDISSALTKFNKCSVSCIFRLHPNLLHGSMSIYESHQHRSSSEFHLTKELVNNLLSVSRRLGFSSFVCSPTLPNKYLLTHPGAVCVTHHGTIGIEAYVLDIPVITTSISPLQTLGSSKCAIVTKNTCNTKVIEAILGLALNGTTIHFDTSKLGAASCYDRYHNKYLLKLAKGLTGHEDLSYLATFDKRIYSKGCSWPTLEELRSPSYKDIDLRKSIETILKLKNI